jgi:hypothetical protein
MPDKPIGEDKVRSNQYKHDGGFDSQTKAFVWTRQTQNTPLMGLGIAKSKRSNAIQAKDLNAQRVGMRYFAFFLSRAIRLRSTGSSAFLRMRMF